MKIGCLNHLHDGEVLSLKKIKGNLYLKLNDFTTFVFACALIDKMRLGINKEKIIFPLEIKSEGTKYLTLNTVETNGILHKKYFVKLKRYLYDEIIEWNENNIEIVFDFWRKRSIRGYLLLLSCTNIKIVESQHEYWEKYFGEKYNKYYNYFINERNKGTFLSDYSLCVKLINKMVQARRHQAVIIAKEQNKKEAPPVILGGRFRIRFFVAPNNLESVS
jgi:hypothetical protein